MIIALGTNGSGGGTVRDITRTIASGVTGALYTARMSALRRPVTFAKSGGDANLTINSAGVISATAGIDPGASQDIEITATGADGTTATWVVTLRGAQSVGYDFVFDGLEQVFDGTEPVIDRLEFAA